MGWTPPDGIEVPEWRCWWHHPGEASVADASGNALFRGRLTGAKVPGLFRSRPRRLVAMEACGGARHWGREIARLGHGVRLIPPAHVKPCVKRQENDAADAEAIRGAAWCSAPRTCWCASARDASTP